MTSQATKKTTAAKTPAVKALEAEATNTPITVDFRGFTLSIDPDVFDDDDAMEALEQTRWRPMMDAITGDPEITEKLRETNRDEHTGRIKRSDCVQMLTELMTAVGQGNS